MDKLEPTHPFLFKSNVSHTWKLWLQQFRFCLTDTEKDNKDDKIKTSMLLTWIGLKGREIYETFTFDSADDEMKLEHVLNKFSEYCNPRKNVTILRHKFFTYRQLEGQSFRDFITELKKLTAEYKLENLWDSLIKDIIIYSTNDNAFRERSLRESGLTLSRAISTGHAAQKTRKHALEILQSQSATDLHKINKLRKPRHQAPNEKSKDIIKKCKFFNGSHPRGKCPAYEKSCLNCNRKNHFKVCCPRNQKKGTRNRANRDWLWGVFWSWMFCRDN